MTRFVETIRRRASDARRRIVFPEGGDARILEAAAECRRLGLLEPVLLGPAAELRRALAGHDGVNGIEIIEPALDQRRDTFADELLELRRDRGMTRAEAERVVLDPLIFAAMLVRTGEVHGSVAGAVSATAAVLRAAIWCLGTAPTIRTVSSAFYMVVPPFRSEVEEVLSFADAGVVPDPDADQLADIARAAALARREIVGDEPRVAFLSYSTHASAAGARPEKMRRALELFRERTPGVAADGELQADAALIRDVAIRKAPDSSLRGDANVLIFPDLDAGNIAYKLVQRLAHAEAFGPIVQGLGGGCNDLSRGASAGDIVNVACITALQRPARVAAGH